MSFKRTVQRDRKNEFTQQPPKPKSEFKTNFNLTWIPFHYKSLIMIIVIFAFTQFLCVPFLAQYYPYSSSVILVHGILTSLLTVLSFQTTAKQKAPATALFIRFCFCALMFGGFALAIMMFVGL